MGSSEKTPGPWGSPNQPWRTTVRRCLPIISLATTGGLWLLFPNIQGSEAPSFIGALILCVLVSIVWRHTVRPVSFSLITYLAAAAIAIFLVQLLLLSGLLQIPSGNTGLSTMFLTTMVTAGLHGLFLWLFLDMELDK